MVKRKVPELAVNTPFDNRRNQAPLNVTYQTSAKDSYELVKPEEIKEQIIAQSLNTTKLTEAVKNDLKRLKGADQLESNNFDRITHTMSSDRNFNFRRVLSNERQKSSVVK